VTSKQARAACFLALAIVSLVAGLFLEAGLVAAAPPQFPPQSPWNSAGFQGDWCAQGDNRKHCYISADGPFLSLRNENGDTSTGFGATTQNTVTAAQWSFVQGTLSADGRRINWTNGTYWTRCQGGRGGSYRPPNLDGTWYRDGKRPLACSIRQNKRNLRLRNESDQTATGTIDGSSHVTTTWSGTTIPGTISKDGNTIYWNNGTSWSR
jgi:hypothetical protein